MIIAAELSGVFQDNLYNESKLAPFFFKWSLKNIFRDDFPYCFCSLA